MNTSQGRLFYATGIDNSQLRSDAEESRNILHSIGQTATQEGLNIESAFGKIAKAAGGIFAIGKAQEFAREIIKVRGDIESLHISFETLLGGNKEKANAMFSEIRSFAVQTPMMLKDLAAGAQTMLGFNIEAEKVMPMLRAIGDISMGDAQKFNSLTLAFSQMSATGKLMGQDLLQMINAGFNPLSVISEKTGKTIGELKEEMEKGKITVEMVTDAFVSATSAGGKYYGMLEKQSKGINGAISNLQGAIDDFYNSIGEASQGGITGALDGATYLVKHYEEVAEILGVIVGTYGVYKAAIITNEALIQSAMVAKNTAMQEAFESEIAAISELLPQKEAEAQTSLQQAVAAGQITEAKAAEIAMLRAEAEAQFEALATTEAAAKARIMASQADVKAAMEWEEEIQKQIFALENEADVLFENGDSIAFNAKQEEIAALKSELLAVQKERETAVQEVNTAANEMNAASHQQNAIAAAEESAATAVNTAQTTTNTGVTSALSIAKTKLTGVVRTLYATISAHPYALAAAAVAVLGYGIYKLITYETEAEKAQKRLTAAVNECEGSIASERIQIDVMFDRLRKAKEGTDDYKNAKDAILQQYGNYLNGLSEEISSLKDVEGAYKAVTQAALEAARARAMDAYVKKEGDEYAKQHQEKLDKIKSIIKEKKGQEFVDRNEDAINKIVDGKSEWNSKFLSKFNEVRTVYMGENSPGHTYIYNPLTELTNQAKKANADYVKLLKNAENKFGVSSKKDNNNSETDGKEPTHNKAYWEKQKKEAENELAALTDIEANGKKGAALRAKITGYNNKLIPFSVSTGGKGGGKNASDVRQQNEDMLANEAANRRKQEEEYAKQLADQIKDSEFEIRQARIDAMKDGIDKELLQNELNYDRLIEQNKRRERDLLDNLADEHMRILEDADPTLFKKKNKDGKLEEDPGKRDEMYREIRAKLTIEDLDPQQKTQIEEFGRIAALAFEKSNKESMDKMFQDVLTYEQQRTKITEEYARKRKDLYEKNADGSTKTDADGNPVFRKGMTQGNLNELNRQETEALKAIDEQFAQREETYQVWCEEISNLSLRRLEVVLEDAKKRLEELEKSGSKDDKALAQARAKVATAQKAVNKANAKNETNPGKRTIKEWEDLYKTLNDVEKEFKSIGDTVGGVVGDIISECGSMASSTLQMINGIVTLANWSAVSIKMTAEGASAAIMTMEKASVTLAIISAAMQIAMQIVNLFNNDDKKQKEIEHLQDRIDQLQWELDHQDIGRIQAEYGTAINRLNKALIETRLELAIGATGWQRLVLLTGQASHNTELMHRTVEKLAKAYGSMEYTVDKAIGADKYRQANDQLKNIVQQQILIQEQINAEASKKKTDNGAIQEWKNKIEELGKEAIDLINELVEDIIGDTSTGIADQLKDAFFDAFQAGEDRAQAWADKVNEIVADILKRMLTKKLLEEPIGEIFNEYKAKWFPNGKFNDAGLTGIIDSMVDFAKDLNSQFDIFKVAMDALPSSLTDILKKGSSTEQDATYGGYETLSEDTGKELEGRSAAIQLAAESINENVKLMREDGIVLKNVIQEINESIKDIQDMMGAILICLLDISKNTSELDEMKEILDNIEKNTKDQ